jgi:serine/threonine protein kinase
VEGASRYRATRLIGRGGAADVYEAVATGAGGFQRRVVLKRLRRENAPDASLARGFIDEARIVAQLHHANIVSVLDFGLADGLPFQVLELVEGLDLGAILDLFKKTGTQAPVEVALFIAAEIARALSYAHRAEDIEGQPLSIVHRDVTPGNILISWAGDVKLGDFGIARAARRLEETAVGFAKGKLEYMAPEQARADDVDGRADLFSLGCVLHQIVAGMSPLASGDARQQMELGREPPLAPTLPEDVRAIVQRALRPYPSARFPDAETMERELGAALAKRARSDARWMLRDLLSPLRAPAKKRGGEIAELFDVELVMRAEEGRRFESRVERPPVQPPPPPPATSSAIMQKDVVTDPLLGSVLDSYRLDDRIGSGGMARVYRATHLVLGNQVAIKVLHGHASPLAQKRFKREAEAMARIAHPNVAKIVDFGSTPGGVPFLVMELLEGRTLKRAVKEHGPFALHAALKLAREVASGLEAIHAGGIVHRDLKPGNVMLTPQGAKILDFGVAVVPDSETRFTAAAQILGTPAYMPPEQIESAKEVDFRADLYALGAILHFACTTRAPTAGASLPSAGGLETIVHELLAPSPEDRPESATEVLEFLAKLEVEPGDQTDSDLDTATPATRVTEVGGGQPQITMPAILVDQQSPTITRVLASPELRPPSNRMVWIAPLMLFAVTALLIASLLRFRAEPEEPVEIHVPDLPTRTVPAVKPVAAEEKVEPAVVEPVAVETTEPAPTAEKAAEKAVEHEAPVAERRTPSNRNKAKADDPPAPAQVAEITDEQVREKLQRVSRSLKAASGKLTGAAYDSLETRYLDLRSIADGARDARARKKLAGDLDALEAAIARTKD